MIENLLLIGRRLGLPAVMGMLSLEYLVGIWSYGMLGWVRIVE